MIFIYSLIPKLGFIILIMTLSSCGQQEGGLESSQSSNMNSSEVIEDYKNFLKGQWISLTNGQKFS